MVKWKKAKVKVWGERKKIFKKWNEMKERKKERKSQRIKWKKEGKKANIVKESD